jgi:hypothetical protein
MSTGQCELCCVLQAQRLAAIVAGDCAALVVANGLIYAHLEEHEQRQREADFAALQDRRQAELIATIYRATRETATDAATWDNTDTSKWTPAPAKVGTE